MRTCVGMFWVSCCLLCVWTGSRTFTSMAWVPFPSETMRTAFQWSCRSPHSSNRHHRHDCEVVILKPENSDIARAGLAEERTEEFLKPASVSQLTCENRRDSAD